MNESKYIDSSVKKYLEDLASDKPAPGGGSAAALAGAIGISALEMVANFTKGKKEYSSVEEEILAILKELKIIRSELERLVDEDVRAYSEVAMAYKLSKETEEQKLIRSQKIQEALKYALDVPFNVSCLLVRAGKYSKILWEKGNRNVACDVVVGTLLIIAAFESAYANVKVNLRYIKDEDYKVKIKEKLEELLMQMEDIKLFSKKILSEIGGNI